MMHQPPQDLHGYTHNCLKKGRRSTTLKIGTESVPETLENLHILTRLSDREHFNEFMPQVCFGGRFSIL